jgi:hypothetical protein
MPQPRTVSLHIEFSIGADPIEGRVRAGNDDGRGFCGWIELTRAIELGLAEACRAERPRKNAVP